MGFSVQTSTTGGGKIGSWTTCLCFEWDSDALKSIITQCHHVDDKLSIAMAISRKMGVIIVVLEWSQFE